MGCSSSSQQYIAAGSKVKGRAVTFSTLAGTSVLELLDPPCPLGGMGSLTDPDLDQVPSFSSKALQTYGEPLDPAKGCFGYSCTKGSKRASPNQDSWCIIRSLDGAFSIYCVFDGHGKKGHDISNFVKDNLVKLMLCDPRFMTAERPAAVRQAFRNVQAMIELSTKEKTLGGEMSGTTCTVVVHDHREERITIAHVGDSGAYIGSQGPKPTTAWEPTVKAPGAVPEGESAGTEDAGKAVQDTIADSAGGGADSGLVPIQLTTDHKPNLPEEKARILKAGGCVAFDGHRNYRVFAKGKQYPGLNMSRCLGHTLGHKEAGMSSEPDVVERKLTPEDRVLLLCSDGVWEFFPPKDALDLVCGHKPAEAMEAAAALGKSSWDAWTKAQIGYVDDITAVIIHLHTWPASCPAVVISHSESSEVTEEL
jgi:serine/threonine protein phosphatase PrpC